MKNKKLILLAVLLCFAVCAFFIVRGLNADKPFRYEHDPRDNPEGLAAVKKSNLEAYGNENGPTADSLFDKYGSWETVLVKSFGTNAGMDACCGLYDDYYTLYLELGMVEE